MAIVLPAWIRYVAKVKPWKLAQLNVRVFDGDAFTLSEEENALQLAQTLENFFEYLGLKTRLNELNITDEHFDLMAKRATRNGTIGHYIPLDEGRFIGILKLAI
jgi:alcohol dehydrogenase